ncbi:MBOAT family O-acyltransferase [Winogradskyella undariae]|uniref:MBOAT family O-acyltransferase n=1 Tax=Winogradskyella undariae TaxID=1285465 RepID=UPI0027B915F7|nr:MBOAT family O-acyltransferase [Winogradskyella undariae]
MARNLTLRNILILVASYTFYGWWDWRFLFLIAISTLVDFYVGKHMHKTEDRNKRKQLLFISLFVNLGFLVYFKYTNFFIESFVDSFRLFGKELEVSTLNIILPVGISFYTFQTLSYTIDIYRKQLKATNNIIAFSAFVAFFPQLVAGPIERASHLLPQFYKTYKFNYKLVKSGLLLIVFGLFKKMVIADRAALYVNEVYNNVDDYGGVGYIYATVLFAFQIYCDFSGYSDIAIGLGRTMGFDLMKNFDSPYISKSLTEFWRRWHISLSTWFRDYLYIPLGGSKKGEYRTYANIFIVFVVSGLWHGASMTFIIWGAIHGIILMIEKGTFTIRKRLFGKLGLDKNNFSNHLFFGIIIFTIVCFGWIFFRANSLSDAFQIVSGIFNSINLGDVFNEETYLIGFKPNEFKVIMIAILMLIVFEFFHKKYNSIRFLNNQATLFRWSFYLSIVISIVLFGIYGHNYNSEFIYFQF